MHSFLLLGLLLLQGTVEDSTRIQDAMAGREFDTRLKYPYELPTAKKRELLTKMMKLRPGDSIRDVVKSIGPPINQSPIAGKEKNAKVRGLVATYYLKNVAWGTNLLKDQVIYLVYGNDLRLMYIDTNIKGLKFSRVSGSIEQSSTIETDALLVTKVEKH